MRIKSPATSTDRLDGVVRIVPVARNDPASSSGGCQKDLNGSKRGRISDDAYALRTIAARRLRTRIDGAATAATAAVKTGCTTR